MHFQVRMNNREPHADRQCSLYGTINNELESETNGEFNHGVKSPTDRYYA